MLATKARALRIEAGLPHFLWVEAIHTACYLANRTPMAKHGWKTAFEVVTGEKSYLSHLKIYGCKTYALNHHIPKKQKLEPRAHIGYLVGYDSTNIFRIWIPSRRKIIRSSDVLFDEVDVYDLADPPDLMHFLSTSSEHAPYEITDSMRNAFADLDAEDENLSYLIDDLLGNTPSISQRPYIELTPPKDLTPPTILPTPSATPTPKPGAGEQEGNITGLPDITTHCGRSTRAKPSSSNTASQAEAISADLDIANVLPEGEKRQRKPVNRHDAYITQLSIAGEGSTEAFHNSFASFATSSTYRRGSAFSTMPNIIKHRPILRAHRDNMPPEPKGFKKLSNHPYCEFFKASMRTEIEVLQRKETWVETTIDEAEKANKTAVPTMWVYKYNLDEDGWLLKFKGPSSREG